MKKIFLYLVTAVMTVFGLLSIFLTTSILFDLFGIRAKEGNYVLFIVWANFICGFLYLISAYGLFTAKKWTYQLLGFSSLILIVAFVGLLVFIQSGGIHENKTVGAMIFRISITIGFTLFSFFTINKNRKVISTE